MYDPDNRGVRLVISNSGGSAATLTIVANAYRNDGPWPVSIAPGAQIERRWTLTESGNWYDFTVIDNPAHMNFLRRFAGRMETGISGISDPALGLSIPSP